MKNCKKQRIFEDIKRRIMEEEWRCGSQLPKMTELSSQYGVSIITLIGAMKLLKEAGFVEQRRRGGTFVRWNRGQIFFPRLDSRNRTVKVTHSLLNASPLYLFIMRQLAESFMRVYPEIQIQFVNVPLSRNQEDPYIQRITSCDVPCCGEFYWHAIYAKLDALLPLEDLPGYEELRSTLIEQSAYPTTDSGGAQHIHALTLYLGLPGFGLLQKQWAESLGVALPRHGITSATILKMLRHGAGEQSSGFFSLALPLPREWHNIKQYVEFLSQGLPREEYALNDAVTIRRILESDRAEELLTSLDDFLKSAGKRICLGKENEYFAFGKVGILPFADSWVLNLLETLHSNISYQAFPRPPVCGMERYRPFHAGFSVGIFRDGISSVRQKNAAWNWLKFLFCEQAQEVCSQSMHIPVHKEASSYVAQTVPDIWRIAKNTLADSLPQPDFVGMRRIYSQMSEPLRQFLRQKIGPKECLALLKKNIEL